MASHNKSLILKLFRDISWAGTRNFNPCLGEDGTCNQHVDDVDSGVDGVEESIGEVQWGRHVVCKTGDSEELCGSFLGLPDTEELDKEVVAEAGVEHLADQEDVGGESGLQHDGHVGGVEEANWVRTAGTTLAGGLDWDLDAEALEVDDTSEDNKGSQKIHDVGEVLSIESLLESTLLVWPCQEQVEERNNRTFEFWATTGVNGRRGESLPDDGLADIGGNEERDTASKTISLLEELIKEDNNQASNNQLKDEEEDNTSAKIGWLTVEASEHINCSLTH